MQNLIIILVLFTKTNLYLTRPFKPSIQQSLLLNYADAYCNMGIALHDQGDYDKSIEATKKAILNLTLQMLMQTWAIFLKIKVS